MKEFIVENWRLIIEIISLIVVVIFFFLKKKPYKVVDAIPDMIYFVLPSAINRAEKIYGSGDGETKRNFVINVVIDYIHDRWPDVNAYDYYDFISARLEDILSTPKKKEVNSNEN